MTLPIRARLTLWYSSVVVVILVTGAIVGSLAQWRLGLQRLDDDLARTLATLEGVMRTEFGEGLDLEAAAAEASLEVVAPGRTMALSRADRTPLESWGEPLEREALPPVTPNAQSETISTRAGERRVLSRLVDYGGRRYAAAVLAPLEPLRAQHAEVVRAMTLGVAMALVAAGIGGWVIGRQTLMPLTRMAEQASRITAREPEERLEAPLVGDELGRLAVSFNGLLDRLGSALHQQRQFMADASHELRTPVSVVRTTAQVTLVKHVRSAEEYRESLVIVGEQADRLSRLVDAMFLLSRAEAQGIPLRHEFLNLDELLAETARALQVLADARRVTVTTDGDQEVGLTGDDALLRQMISNLLDNAIRHAQIDGRVTASLTRTTDRVTLQVTNDGRCIAAADQERIFERFVRIGSSDGAGLGLPIARWIAEAHGGTVRLLESHAGCTTFIAILPVDPVINGSSAG